VRVQFLGATPPSLSGAERLPGVVNLLRGSNPARWRSNLPTYAGLTYTQLYAGIDLAYSGRSGQLKSTYTIAPGADVARLRWRYQGATRLQLDPAGNLLISLPSPRVGETTPLTLTE
jgi:hypothetical protein